MADLHTGFGVGVVYSGALAEPLIAQPDMVDAVSLIPETLWHESADGVRYRWISAAVGAFDLASAATPVVFHGIGLSIGGGLPLDLEHLDQIIAAADRYSAAWYSEHLAAFRVGHATLGQAHAGVGLPVPFDTATLRELSPKVATVVSRLARPMLLENSAIYVDVPDTEMSEAAFLNRLCDEAGCGVLLDLHNLVVNEVNLGWDLAAYLDELDLSNVVEIHVAGGEMLGAWYTDAHSGSCPERVWELLDAVVPVTPELRLVTFEMHESRYDVLGGDGLADQLSRIRATSRSRVSGVA